MKRMAPAKCYSRRRLKRFVAETVSLAKDLCPEAEIRVKIPGYEELDAFIGVIVPDEMVGGS